MPDLKTLLRASPRTTATAPSPFGCFHNDDDEEEEEEKKRRMIQLLVSCQFFLSSDRILLRVGN